MFLNIFFFNICCLGWSTPSRSLYVTDITKYQPLSQRKKLRLREVSSLPSVTELADATARARARILGFYSSCQVLTKSDSMPRSVLRAIKTFVYWEQRQKSKE